MEKALYLVCFLLLGVAYGQPANDACVDAIQLCPNVTLSGTTIGATTDGASDHPFCGVPSSTIWYKFTSNAADNATVHFTNLVFDPDPTKGQLLEVSIFGASTPCDQTSYTIYSPCSYSAVDFDVITGVVTVPGETYYVQINGTTTGAGVTDHADCDFDISISGPAVDETPPTVTTTPTSTDFCQGIDSPINVVVTDCVGSPTYEWIWDGSTILVTTMDTFSTEILPDTGDLQLVVTCGTVCLQDDTSALMTFNITPIAADAGPDKFIAEGGTANLEGAGMGDPLWTPSTDLTDPISYTPTATPTETTTYFLTVTNGNCTADDEMTVFVGAVIVTYSGFTPNNDGINDKWIIGNSSQFPNMEVTIYDRSGQKVFSATNYDTPDKWWDGTYKGKDLPASAYYYVINLNEGNDDDIYKGMVSIIR